MLLEHREVAHGGRLDGREQSDVAKRGVQQAIESFRELSELEAQARNKTWKVLQDRLQENMTNLQKLLLVK